MLLGPWILFLSILSGQLIGYACLKLGCYIFSFPLLQPASGWLARLQIAKIPCAESDFFFFLICVLIAFILYYFLFIILVQLLLVLISQVACLPFFTLLHSHIHYIALSPQLVFSYLARCVVPEDKVVV